MSRDNLAVLEDSVDNKLPAALHTVPPPVTAVTATAVTPEVYGRTTEREELIPRRAVATRREQEERDGCYYVVAALDFCWCL